MKILRICIAGLFVIVLAVYVMFYIKQLSVDKTIPVINIDGEMLEVSISASDEELLRGVTAYDEKDGDITDKIIIESISRFTEKGVSIVKYAVCDNDNHVASNTRKITYTNYTSPRFTLSDSLVFGLSQSFNVRNIIGAVDSIDGDISNKVIITTSEYSSNATGVYYISAKVTNSKGDMISLLMPVYVEDLSLAAPEIELENYLVYLKKGDNFDYKANVLSATDVENNDLKSQVKFDTNLDVNSPGFYEVHYRVSDSMGRVCHEILFVVVEE